MTAQLIAAAKESIVLMNKEILAAKLLDLAQVREFFQQIRTLSYKQNQENPCL